MIKSRARSADGCYHTRPLESATNTKREKKELSERAKRIAEKRDSDAEVCRRCTKAVCRGSAECIAKQRQIQEAQDREREQEKETEENGR